MIELKDLRNYFIFDGVPSTDFELYINGKDTFGGPGADVEMITVPGKTGDLIRFNNRYLNATVSYDSWIADDMRINLRGLRSMLLSRVNKYYRLEDTYHPDEFRLAAFSGGLDPSVSFENTLANFTLSFTCKPQRFLKSGETTIRFDDNSESHMITNPTPFPCRPVIRIYGNGNVQVGNSQIAVSNNENTYLDLDCEIMDAHTGAVNRNADIEVSHYDYVTLPAGRSQIFHSTRMTVEITPRWFYL